MKTKGQRISRKNLAEFRRKVQQIWLAIVACCVSTGGILVPGVARAATPIPITACQSITTTGYYQVQNTLSSTGGDCLVIQAPYVTLNLNGNAISGSGTGAGIHVLDNTAPDTSNETEIKGVFIEGGSAIISGFATGIEDNAIGTFGEDFQVNSNKGDGLLLRRARGGHYSTFSAEANGVSGVHIRHGSGNTLVALGTTGNTVYGVWLDDSSNNSIDENFAAGNGIAGYYLGCSPTGPNGVSCTHGSSSSNLIFSSVSFGSAFGSILTQQYGIAVDLGNNNNRIANNGSTSNAIDDMLDENASCGTNIWFFNGFGTANPASCIN